MNKKTIYLIIALVVAAFAAYFVYDKVRDWVSMAIKGVVVGKAAGKVVDVATAGVAGDAGGAVEEAVKLPGKVFGLGK